MVVRSALVVCLLCLGAQSLCGQAYGSFDLNPLVGKGESGSRMMDPNEKRELCDSWKAMVQGARG